YAFARARASPRPDAKPPSLALSPDPASRDARAPGAGPPPNSDDLLIDSAPPLGDAMSPAGADARHPHERARPPREVRPLRDPERDRPRRHGRRLPRAPRRRDRGNRPQG